MGRGWLALLLVGAWGCSPRAWLESQATAKETLLAKEAVTQLAHKDVDGLVSRLTPELREQLTPDLLAKMLAEIPPGAPADPTLVGYHHFASPGTTRAQLSLQYRYPEAYLLAHVQVRTVSEVSHISSLYVQRIPDSLEKLNAFRLSGRRARHFVVLAFAIVIPLFVVVMLVLCARTPNLRRKWLWLLFVAFGWGQLSLNWTSGALSFRPLNIQLFGAAAMAAGPYAPWILSVSLPLGAAWFALARWRRTRRPNPQAGGGVEPVDEAQPPGPVAG